MLIVALPSSDQVSPAHASPTTRRHVRIFAPGFLLLHDHYAQSATVPVMSAYDELVNARYDASTTCRSISVSRISLIISCNVYYTVPDVSTNLWLQ